MTTFQSEFPKAFAVWFKDLYRWDVSSFHRVTWHWPAHFMRPIGEVLRLRRERVDRSRIRFSELQPITIHFDGSIEKRFVDAGREYTMNLWFARPGDIVVAKIDLKNGAVGIVPPNWQNVVVTSHFAVYQPDRTMVVPEYLQRIIQSSFFKAHLWRNKVGAEGRKEVKLDFFEQEKIPLPSLAEQEAIVTLWYKAQDEITAVHEKVEQQRAAIDEQFISDLGLQSPGKLITPKAFAVRWADLGRWGVRFNQLSQTGVDIAKGKYPVVDLDSLLELVQYGTSVKANSEGKGVPVLRIGNIKDRALDLSSLKHVVLPKSTIDSLLLRDGDVVIIRTSGSRDLIGTSAVFRERVDFVFASYLIRLRFSEGKVIPEFVSWFLNSPLGRQQVEAVSRKIMQNNINSQELRSLQIPLPPLQIQEQIMKRVAESRAEIAREREAAKKHANHINSKIEALILGTQNIQDIEEFAHGA